MYIGNKQREIVISAVASGKPSSNPMTEDHIGVNAVLLADASTEESVYISTHVPADWKSGEDISAKIHCMNVSAQTGTKAFIIGLEYASIGADEDGTPSTTTIESTKTLANNQSAEVMMEADSLTISGAALAVDDVLSFRLYRKAADAGDTMTGDLAIVTIHLQYLTNELKQ